MLQSLTAQNFLLLHHQVWPLLPEAAMERSDYSATAADCPSKSETQCSSCAIAVNFSASQLLVLQQTNETLPGMVIYSRFGSFFRAKQSILPRLSRAGSSRQFSGAMAGTEVGQEVIPLSSNFFSAVEL